MELQEQIKRIESLKTDKYLRLLIKGIAFAGFDFEGTGVDLQLKHKSKNSTINNKLHAYFEDFTEILINESEDFYTEGTNYIAEYCGFLKNDDVVLGYLLEFSEDINVLVDKLKTWVIECDKVPDGHIGIMSNDGKMRFFLDED